MTREVCELREHWNKGQAGSLPMGYLHYELHQSMTGDMQSVQHINFTARLFTATDTIEGDIEARILQQYLTTA